MKFTRLLIASLAMAGLMYGCGGDSEEESGAPVPETTAELCSDGIDNDGDGLKDCDVDTCKQFDNCKGAEGDKECPASMPEGKKDCSCDKATGEWKDCQDIGAEEKECSTDMPDGKKDCTCDKTTGEWVDCQDDVVEKECPTDMPDGKKDCTCDKTTGEWTDCQDDVVEKECPVDMPEGKKDCTCDKSTGEWADCQDIGSEDKECPADMPEGKKDCTCDKTTGEWTSCTDIASGDKECPADMPEGKKDCTCDKTTGEWKDCQDIASGDKECSADMPEGKKDCTCDKTTGEWKDCKDDVAEDTDKNNNHMKDSKESATISETKNCLKHSECSSGFCDSFIGKCATRCSGDDDCMEGFICRPDGRCAAEAFETVWHISAANEELSMPMSTGVCDYKIDWGDGSAPEEFKKCPANAGDVKHKYTKAGDYHVKITGTYSDWCMSEGHIGASCMVKDEELKLIEVVSYGPVGLGGSAFASAKNLAKLPTLDIPDATLLGCRQKNAEGCNELWDMFYSCEKLKTGLANWDVSNVTQMHNMFAFAKVYDESLNKWDTSNVTTMEGMFVGAEKFNGHIDKWDTAKVTSMYSMFEGAETFNQDISGWKTSKVTNMQNMFKNAKKFNKSLAKWNMSNITNMASMFDGATAYSYAFENNNTTAASKIKKCDEVKKSFEGTAVSCDALTTMRKGTFFLNLENTCTVKDLKSTCTAN